MRMALTIAGSDSGAGAGIQADIKTFAAHGVYGTTAITAVTAQNTRGVVAFTEVTPELIRQQIEAVMIDLGTDAAKTGMLASAATVETVARAIGRRQPGRQRCGRGDEDVAPPESFRRHAKHPGSRGAGRHHHHGG
jgi:hydroxymethylpyrimidine/phosphomethylpyrimidine kinase